jgi:type II secretory ATPase GspE/PulE/Tfp pilus assembly ATPase PilB-like protein
MKLEWITDQVPDIATAQATVPLASVTAINGRPNEPIMVEHAEDLPVFSRKLYDMIRMLPSLRHRLCPIDVSTEENPNSFAVVLLLDELHTQLTGDLIHQLKEKGWMHAADGYYVAPQAVMVGLARDGINENRKAGKGGVGSRQHDSALWNMFEGAAAFALEVGASDIHVEIDRSKPESQIKFRVDGRLTAPREFQIDTFKLLDMAAYLYNVHSNSGSENAFNENQAQQCQIALAIKGQKLLFRWASNKTAAGSKIVMRVITQDSTSTIWSLEQLGYLEPQLAIWRRALSRLGGGILVSGVVNSGKSKTLQTVMSMLPGWMAKYTVEDPVENLIPGASQFSISRSLTDSGEDPFLPIKRQTKRMDPDAVMIGELRDQESASLFRDIAESGHRALASVHAPAAIDTITLRLVSSEMGIPRDVIATPNFINLLVYQGLVPKICRCKRNATDVYDKEYLARIERLFSIDRTLMKAKNDDGCEACRRKGLPELQGFKGRQLVAEMIELTPKMLLLFRESKNLELKNYIRSTRTARFDEPDSTGKSALEVAMYHVSQGIIDPREVENKFGSFEQYEAEQAEMQAMYCGRRRARGALPRPDSFRLRSRMTSLS